METKIEIKKIFKNVWSVLQGVMRSEMKSIRYEVSIRHKRNYAYITFACGAKLNESLFRGWSQKNCPFN